jgi:amino acid adenylation domain-containing protein
MQADTVEVDLSRRLAALSPDRRALLQRLMQANVADAVPVDEIPIQSRAGRRDFPLSAAQERMWFNHQWSPNQPLYSESFGLIIHGDLKPDLLQKSFDYLMVRHEIFSVTFHSSEGGFFQRIGSAALPRMEICDLRQMPEPQREATYEAESHRLLREPFHLESGPLFRAGVWITGEDEYRLIFAMHHIIFDGWSGGIFLRELFAAYNAMVEGHPPALPPVGAQYVDFAMWEQSQLEHSSPAFERQLDYWRQQLDGVSGPPALPVDRHVSDDAHTAGREAFVCSPASTEALRTLTKESGATMFMALLAAFKLLLARYSGQEDIVVGIPTSNRNQSALRDMIGVFINTVILRTDISGELTFRELLARVRKTTLDAQANQELPLQRVVRLLDSKGDPGRSLIRVLFDLQRKPGWLLESPGLLIEPMEVSSGVAKFDIVLALEDTGTELKGVLDYDAEKFEAGTAQQLVRHFLTLVESAVAQPNVPVIELPILTPDELEQAEMRGVDTSNQVQPFACAETIARALERPHALALQDGRSTLSYGQLHARAANLAAFLHRQNIGKGQHIVLFLPPGPDFVVAQLAVMMAGAAFVPIDPTYPQARVEFMIRDCEAKFAIVSDKSPCLPSGSITAIDVERDYPKSGTGELTNVTSTLGSDPAYMIYTSGSTGQPKGVSVSYAALANLIAWHRRVFDISSRDRAAQMASVAFDASIWEIWPYLAAGASVHFPPRDLLANPAAMRDWLIKNKITVGFAATQLAEEMVALRWPSVAKLRHLLTGGDRLRKTPPADLPFQLINNYGPTENTVVSTSGVVASTQNGAAPNIGHPIDNVWARIVDRSLKPVPLGAQGELIVGGQSLANGYWNQPELTSQRFITLANGERAYRTGDLCRFRRDGEIEFCGRIDMQVKLRGCRIELGEVENVLLTHDGIRDAVTDVRELANGQKGIVAYIVPRGSELATEALRVFLGERLPRYMVPSSFVQIDSLPKTSNGKIDRKKLPSPNAQLLSEQLQIRPRSVTEIEIAALWKNLLQLESVTISDDFFELGGDSLLATRLATAMREKFAVELPLGRMMSAPTIGALAAFVDGKHGSTSKLPDGVILLRSQTGSESLPPLFFTPPASGSPACYVALASSLTEDRAAYGFEAAGLTRGKTIGSVAAQASQYVEALESVYPEGPCFIAGWSLGGPVAFEMACQLRDAGREVAYLALIDAGLPENGRLPGGTSMMVPLWWAISYPFVEHVPLNYQTLRMLARWVGISLPESLGDVWRRGAGAGSRFAAGLLASGRRSLRVFLASMGGFRRHEPRFFDGKVTLFRTIQGSKLDRGQDVLLKNLRQWCRQVEVHEAPGSHMTLMLDPKLSSAFAFSFEATLNVELAHNELQSS